MMVISTRVYLPHTYIYVWVYKHDPFTLPRRKVGAGGATRDDVLDNDNLGEHCPENTRDTRSHSRGVGSETGSQIRLS